MERIVTRLLDAMNRHDASAIAASFAPGYLSEQPSHPRRGFGGSEQVLANWTSVFEGVPDFAATLLRSAQDSGWTWTEWQWSGTHTDGTPFAMAGVIMLRVSGNLIHSARLYMEPIEAGGDDINESVQNLYRSEHP